MPKLKVFVSSTCYDLSIVREQLRKYILDNGHLAELSDYSDFGFDPAEHTHVACIKEVADADIVIVIIGGRFGGKIVPQALFDFDFEALKKESKSSSILQEPDKLSVTQMEILKAIELGIPIFPFIEYNVLRDHLTYEKNKKLLLTIGNQFNFDSIEKQETAQYIFEFINFIRHRSQNNAIYPFQKLEDIFTTLNAQFSNMLQKHLENIKTTNLGNRQINNKVNRFPELFDISYSYNDTDWHKLLEKAKVLDLCMLYSGTEWNSKNLIHFVEYLKGGGTINLFLPDEKGISSRFYDTVSFRKDAADKIYRTINYFKAIASKADSKNLHIKISKEGFNYVYSRIEKEDGEKLFLLSPYPNNYSKSETPVIIYNEKNASRSLKNFIESEIEFLKDSISLPDFEAEKYIVWNTKRNRVFISTHMSCPGGCKFCYVDSLVGEVSEKGNINIARLIKQMVRNDTRFKEGRNGTVIMLGAFTDPFLPKNFEATVEIVNFFSIHNNPIHIAAKYTLGHNIDKLFSVTSNVVINISISCLEKDVEVNNQEGRFAEAAELIKRGYKVALFVRPVIKDVTLKDIDKIILLAKNAGIRIVTIGGLYVDQRIIAELNKVDISIDELKVIKKQFVLDDKNVLKKMKIDDIEVIRQKFQENDFRTFTSSDERISFYTE